MSPQQTVHSILDARHKTHGDWVDQSRQSQQLKNVMRNFNKEGWQKLSESQQEVLEALAFKISRVLNGDPNHPDHWLDMSGYPMLEYERLMSKSVDKVATLDELARLKNVSPPLDNFQIEIYKEQLKNYATKLRDYESRIERYNEKIAELDNIPTHVQTEKEKWDVFKPIPHGSL